jgi:hypothetical protein
MTGGSIGISNGILPQCLVTTATGRQKPHRSRAPSRTGLYQVIAAPLETLLALRDDAPKATGLPAYVRRVFYDYL